MEEQKRKFAGVWIPKEIYLNKELSWTEKILFIEIDSLDNEDGCYSKNDYFATFLGVSESHVSRMISKLKKLGLISVESFDGRTRVLHSVLKLSKADYAKMSRQTTQKCQGRLRKNDEQNNISTNIYNIPPISPKGGRNENEHSTFETRFNTFWEAYPRKVGKKAAEGVFKRLKVDDTLLDKLLKALEWQKKSDDWTRDEGRYIPHPRTWLSQGRWEDEPKKPPEKTDKGKGDDYLF